VSVLSFFLSFFLSRVCLARHSLYIYIKMPFLLKTLFLLKLKPL